MEKIRLKGVKLEYNAAKDMYIADGVEIPSVIDVLSKKFTDFTNVQIEPIHAGLNKYLKGFGHTEEINDEIEGYKILQKQHDIVPLLMGNPVIIFNDNKPIMGGYFEILADITGKLAITDLSTTRLGADYLGYLLNLYRVGLYQSYGQEVERLAGIYLKGNERELIDVPIDDFKVKEIIETL